MRTPGAKFLRKPPLGTLIDWSHPLSHGLRACWLMNEGTGSYLLEPITGRQGVGASWIVGSDGPLMTSVAVVIPYHPSLRPKNDFTLVTRRVLPSISGDEFGNILSTNEDSTFEFHVSICVVGFSIIRIRYGGSFWQLGTVPTGDHIHGLTRSAAGVANYYVDGVLNDTTGVGSGAIADSGLDLLMGEEPGGFSYTQQVNWTLLYDRVLSAAELRSFNTDQFAYLQPPNSRRFFSPLATSKKIPWHLLSRRVA